MGDGAGVVTGFFFCFFVDGDVAVREGDGFQSGWSFSESSRDSLLPSPAAAGFFPSAGGVK